MADVDPTVDPTPPEDVQMEEMEGDPDEPGEATVMLGRIEPTVSERVTFLELVLD